MNTAAWKKYRPQLANKQRTQRLVQSEQVRIIHSIARRYTWHLKRILRSSNFLETFKWIYFYLLYIIPKMPGKASQHGKMWGMWRIFVSSEVEWWVMNSSDGHSPWIYEDIYNYDPHKHVRICTFVFKKLRQFWLVWHDALLIVTTCNLFV